MGNAQSAGIGILLGGLLAAWAAGCGGSDEWLLGGHGDHGGASASGGGAAGQGAGDGTGAQGGMSLGGGSGGGISGCNPQSFTLEQAPPPEIYLVIDRSGSMAWPGNTPGLSKWQELVAAADAALTQYQNAIEFGLLMYPTGDMCDTPGPQVPPALGNRPAVMGVLQGAVPLGGTPTAQALQNAASSLAQEGDPKAPDFLVLATDGGPNCNMALWVPCSCAHAAPAYCCTAYPQQGCSLGLQCLDDQHTLDVIGSLKGQGIDTFVIGLPGTSQYEGLLNAMAQAGGRPQQGGNTDYYAAANKQELLAALQTIAGSVISCQIPLAQAPEHPDGVTVYVDGQLVPRDPSHQNGWDYTDETHTTIELYGAACDKLQDGSQHTLTATFACEVR